MSELEARLRENRARLLRPKFAESLRLALGLSVEPRFLPLDDTAVLKRRFVRQLTHESGRTMLEFGTDFERMIVGIETMDASVLPEELVLFHHLDEAIGAAICSTASVIARAADVWRVTHTGLNVCEQEMHSGLSAEPDFIGADEVFGVTAWGVFAEALAE